jgi:MoaA/NifB/PqqE/SkfB family radical SAM enzyme
MKKINFLFKCANVYFHYHIKKYIPFVLSLQITDCCNLNCNFCIIPQKTLNELKIKKIFGIINDAKKIGIPYISIFGGEPLLRKDVVKIGNKIKSSGIVSVLTTNGCLINEKLSKKLSNAYDFIKISFCGLENTHNRITGNKNSYIQSIKGLNYLIKNKKKNKILLHFVVNKNNYKEIEKFIERFKNKVDGINLLPEIYYEKKYDDILFQKLWKKLYKEKKVTDSKFFINQLNSNKIICDAGKLFNCIYPNGDVNACSTYNNLILGNVDNERYFDIYNKKMPNRIKKKIKSCKGCYLKCSTEISQIFRLPPHKLLYHLPSLLKTYKIL